MADKVLAESYPIKAFCARLWQVIRRRMMTIRRQ